MTTLNLGFIGLGIRGTPMAAHLRAAGHTLYEHSRSAPPQAFLDAGWGRLRLGHKSRTEGRDQFHHGAQHTDVKKVLFDKDGVAAALSRGKVAVDKSAIDPMATKAFAKQTNAGGLT